METQNSFIDPEKVIGQLGLSEGITAADFGCGTGYFTFALAKKIGERGILYSLDVLPQIIEVIESQAKVEGLKNIVTKRVNFEKEGGSTLEANSLDLVILKDVLYQNQDKGILLKEAKRVLKKGGKALIVEWRKEAGMIGPDVKLRLDKDEIMELAKADNWEISTDVDAGKFHWGFVVIK